MYIRFNRRDYDPRELLDNLAFHEKCETLQGGLKHTRNGSSIRVRLIYSKALDPAETTRRRSASGRKTVGVTWGVHRGFLMRLFGTFPDAVVRSNLATYRGKDDFLAKHYATYDHNAGTRYNPVRFGDL